MSHPVNSKSTKFLLCGRRLNYIKIQWRGKREILNRIKDHNKQRFWVMMLALLYNSPCE